jgi:hypothetical protein
VSTKRLDQESVYAFVGYCGMGAATPQINVLKPPKSS